MNLTLRFLFDLIKFFLTPAQHENFVKFPVISVIQGADCVLNLNFIGCISQLRAENVQEAYSLHWSSPKQSCSSIVEVLLGKDIQEAEVGNQISGTRKTQNLEGVLFRAIRSQFCVFIFPIKRCCVASFATGFMNKNIPFFSLILKHLNSHWPRNCSTFTCLQDKINKFF